MDAYGEVTRPDRELDFGDREVVLRADLAHRDPDDCIWTSVRFLMRGPRPPRPGELVMLVDVGRRVLHGPRRVGRRLGGLRAPRLAHLERQRVARRRVSSSRAERSAPPA